MASSGTYFAASSSGLLCGVCRLWLLDPVQTDCGERVCRTCFPCCRPGETLACPLCRQVADDGTKPFHIDKAANRCMRQLIVRCDVCLWVGPANEVRQHWNTCLQTASICIHCQQTFPQGTSRAHMLQCREMVMDCLCGNQVTKAAAIYHHLTCPLRETHSVLPQAAVPDDQERLEVWDNVDTPPSSTLGHTPSLISASSSRHEPASVPAQLTPGTSELDSPSALLSVQELTLTPGTSQPGSALAPLPVQGERPLSSLLRPFTLPQEIEENQLATAWSTVADIANVADFTHLDQPVFPPHRNCPEQVLHNQGQLVMPVLRPVAVTDGQAIVFSSACQGNVDSRLDYAWNTSYDGHFIWKIAPVSEYLDQATRGSMVSIISVPFFSSPRGYKVCMMLYPQGYRMAQGSYLSLALMLMRGEYDSILDWPFPLNARMTLLDLLRQGKDVTWDVFPDGSEEFHRPQTEIKLASLHPQFAPINVYDQDHYVCNDEMYIKCDLSS